MANNSQETSIVPISDDLGRSISSFSPTMEAFLIDVGLPTENILSPIAARKTIIDSLKNVLDSLPYEERQKSYYLTKFTVAVTVGLFDGRLESGGDNEFGQRVYQSGQRTET